MVANMKKLKASSDKKDSERRLPDMPRSWWIWLLALAMLSGVCLLHVNARIEVVRIGYSLSRQAAKNRKLLAQRRKLALEVATLKSPRRLRRLAMDKLGMTEPSPSQTIKVEKNAKGKLALNN